MCWDILHPPPHFEQINTKQHSIELYMCTYTSVSSARDDECITDIHTHTQGVRSQWVIFTGGVSVMAVTERPWCKAELPPLALQLNILQRALPFSTLARRCMSGSHTRHWGGGSDINVSRNVLRETFFYWRAAQRRVRFTHTVNAKAITHLLTSKCCGRQTLTCCAKHVLAACSV